MLRSTYTAFLTLLAFQAFWCASALPAFSDAQTVLSTEHQDTKVLILGGGMAGVIAARTLHEQGIDFIIVEARHELGGRLMSHTFGEGPNQWTVEVGANWVQGTQTGNGPANPVWELAKKHNMSLLSSQNSQQRMTTRVPTTAIYRCTRSASAGRHDRPGRIRALGRDPDLTICNGIGVLPVRLGVRRHAGGDVLACFVLGALTFFFRSFNWRGLAERCACAVWTRSEVFPAHNNTFKTFSPENLLSVDQRGFKTLIQAEAAEFLKEDQIRLNATVSTVTTTRNGVSVMLTDGTTISANYALCTFSLGVLQHDDVRFIPPLPVWKQEAIHSMAMGTYTKIFLQFPENFWFDTEMALYADHERGRYPVWQTLDHAAFFPGCGILFVTVTGTFSHRIESMSDAAVQAEILTVLGTMFPNVTIPEPLDFYFQRWHSDPLFRGSYSNWPANFLSEHQGNLRATVDDRLWFAGEATSKKWFGYLHGAYAEGEAIALALVRCIKDGLCGGLEHRERVRNALPYDIE